jgi:glycosyltransferase involved in cell wall biosynthesis
MTHYFYDPVGIARSTEFIKNPVFISEGCPTTNPFFQKYFDKTIPHYQLPFAFSERFVGESSVGEKSMKCLAVGSVTEVFQRDFREYYKSDSPVLHPMRRVIYQARESLRDVIECRIRDLSHSESETNPQSRKSTYFREDLADLYKSHILFISPEEIVGLPSVNFVDGMAAGTAYIGARDEMYSNLGMQEGVHYIAYSAGNLEDLISKLRHSLENPDKVKKIAQAGFEFAMNHFSPKEVVGYFEKIAGFELKSKIKN